MQPCPSRCTALRLVGQALRLRLHALRVRIRVGYVLRPGPRRTVSALPALLNILSCVLALRANTGICSGAARKMEWCPCPPSQSRYAGSQLRLLVPRACLPSHPLAGRISRLHTRDRCAGARHAVRNPCYTPEGLPKINSANLYSACANRSQFATASCFMRKIAL